MPSPGTLAVLRDLFAIMDTDGSNSIEPSELCILLRSLGYHPSPGEAEQIVNIFDTDGNGTLGFDEFVRVVGWKMGERDQVQTHRQTFALFAGGKSALAAKDLKRVARELDQELTEEDIAMILTESDLDGDGEVGWEDWVRVMAQGVSISCNYARLRKVACNVHSRFLEPLILLEGGDGSI
ncbi:hypothetical protein BC832DRAFT_531587 [Gaertneriomyces semiglobifer]|nr:hypothetical protein BC832DRAFT_531587 [Gaertneriomyces semiglobifer]